VSLGSASFADGPATLRATAVDTSDNLSFVESTIVIDNTNPTLDVAGPDGQTFGPGTTQTWTLTAGDVSSGVASTQCAVTASGAAPTLGPCSTPGAGHSVSGLSGGSYTFTARATDGAGNQTTVTRSFSIDATAPDTAITSGPAAGSVTGDATPTFELSATEPGSSFECRLYASGTTAPAFGPCSSAASHTSGGLADGAYTFEARAKDPVGNVDADPVGRAFTVDTTAPDTSITKHPKKKVFTKKRKVTVSFAFATTEPGSVFRCSLDGAAFVSCAPATSFKVKRGAHNLRVVSVDGVSNADVSPATYSWKVKKKS
jgi:hypothetical protein